MSCDEHDAKRKKKERQIDEAGIQLTISGRLKTTTTFLKGGIASEESL